MSPGERRTVLLGATICLAALIALRGVPWALRTADAGLSALQEQAELLARAEADLRAAPALEDSGRVVRKRLAELAPKILTGGHEAEVLTDLTGRLDVAAEAHQVRVARTGALPDSVHAGSLRRVSVRADIEGDTRGTLEFLAALARGTALLGVTDIRILAADPASPASAAEVLRTELTVSAWYLTREGRQ